MLVLATVTVGDGTPVQVVVSDGMGPTTIPAGNTSEKFDSSHTGAVFVLPKVSVSVVVVLPMPPASNVGLNVLVTVGVSGGMGQLPMSAMTKPVVPKSLVATPVVLSRLYVVELVVPDEK